MLSKNELKYYADLLHKKYRKSEKRFLVEGKKLIEEALDYGFSCEALIFTNDFKSAEDEFLRSVSRKIKRLETVKTFELARLCDTKTPQGIVGVFHEKTSEAEPDLTAGIIIALENINDPGNMGAILRNADWFGVSDVLINGECAEVFSPKVIRSSAGSVFHLNLIDSENFYDDLANLNKAGFKILCSDLNGSNICDVRKTEKSILVFSNEGNGPSEALLEISDTIITIPKKGKAESLNVASASAVIISHFCNCETT